MVDKNRYSGTKLAKLLITLGSNLSSATYKQYNPGLVI